MSEQKEAPRLNAAAKAAIEDALRRHVTVQVMVGSGGTVQVMEVSKKIVYRAP